MEFNDNFPRPHNEQFSQSVHRLFPSSIETKPQQYDSGTVNAVWEKASKEFGFYFFRRDHLGKIISKQEFGEKTQYGWKIAHIVPLSDGGTDTLDNLRPLHWEHP